MPVAFPLRCAIDARQSHTYSLPCWSNNDAQHPDRLRRSPDRHRRHRRRTAGEADPDVKDETPVEEIGSLIKPAPGTVAKNESQPPASPDEPNLKHG